MNETEVPKMAGATPRTRDKDGLHKRRGIWHYKLKVAGKWKEFSTKSTNYQKARKTRHDALQAQEEGRLPTDYAKLVLKKLVRHGLRNERARLHPRPIAQKKSDWPP